MVNTHQASPFHQLVCSEQQMLKGENEKRKWKMILNSCVKWDAGWMSGTWIFLKFLSAGEISFLCNLGSHLLSTTSVELQEVVRHIGCRVQPLCSHTRPFPRSISHCRASSSSLLCSSLHESHHYGWLGQCCSNWPEVSKARCRSVFSPYQRIFTSLLLSDTSHLFLLHIQQQFQYGFSVLMCNIPGEFFDRPRPLFVFLIVINYDSWL